MAKKNKKNIIPKNRDIEEIIEKEEQKSIEKIKQTEYKEDITMEDVISQIDKKDQEAKNKRKKQQEQFKKKLQNIYARKDAQVADQKRQDNYLKAIARIEQKEKEDQEEQEK
ncbi:MAG: hypothetical protein HFJ41_02565 [Clostridia bacterium]|nr:hypothetical protein [Clostridia bacterium]